MTHRSRHLHWLPIALLGSCLAGPVLGDEPNGAGEPDRSPIALALTADGRRLLVANQTAGSVSWVDPVAGRVVSELKTGDRPSGVAISPDGMTGVVAHWYGYDLAILGHIIHSEGEKWGKKLIKKMYRILTDNGMLLIAEMIPNDTRSGPMLPLLFGLNMLVHTEAGDVFTMRQYREWLKDAGFRKVQNLAGGILAWADRIDPTVPKY